MIGVHALGVVGDKEGGRGASVSYDFIVFFDL